MPGIGTYKVTRMLDSRSAYIAPAYHGSQFHDALLCRQFGYA